MATQRAVPAAPTAPQPEPECWETILKRHIQPITMWGPHYYAPDFNERLQTAWTAALREIKEKCTDE